MTEEEIEEHNKVVAKNALHPAFVTPYIANLLRQFGRHDLLAVCYITQKVKTVCEA